MEITETLAGFVATFDAGGRDSQLVERVKLLSLDLAGSIIRGGNEVDSTPAIRDMVSQLAPGAGKCSVLADSGGYSAGAAALLNGVFAHSLDFDDTHAAAILHPGAAVIPAAWAAAESRGASGQNTISAIIAGYEVALRIALALPAGDHYNRGFHPSATCGAFGAAAAASRAMHLDSASTANAFGIVLSQAAGSLQFLDNGAWTKRFQVGWASMSGLMAAILASQGFRGASQPIEGRHGFLAAHASSPNPDRVIEGLGTEFTLLDTGIKPYPSCRWGHAAIDAILELRRQHSIKPRDVTSVRVGLSRAGILLIGEPLKKKQNPKNTVEAQFSAPFVIACAIDDGKVEWDSFRRVGAPDLMSLCQKVSVWNDPEIEAEFPKNMSASVEVVAGANTYRNKVIVPAGDPSNFMSEADIMAKYLSLVGDYKSPAKAEKLAQKLMTLDTMSALDLRIDD